MMRHINIPVFIPHLGCPHDCIFCNQRSISGKNEFDMSSVDLEIDTALSGIVPGTAKVEIAFFGGSFTGIDQSFMINLLEKAQKYIHRGDVASIRISTRPDYIDEETLTTLARYHVTDIELGIQSMSDQVLQLCRRGHSAEQARRACEMITSRGFNLVGQMMIGLPGADETTEQYTAEQIVQLGCSGARIYPIVAFQDTKLATALQNGIYSLPENEELIERSAKVLDIFVTHNVNVLRIGLCAQEGLTDGSKLAAGTFDPAIGERVQSLLFRKKIKKYLDTSSTVLKNEILTVACPVGATSKVIGHKKCNSAYFQTKYGIKAMKIIEKNGLVGYNIVIV